MLQVFLGYLAGLATLLNPCVLPLLPIIAASALQESKKAPFFLALGLSVSTAFAGFILTVFGRKLGISEQDLANFGAGFLVFFGVLILLPQRFSPFKFMASAASGFSSLSMRLSGSPLANFAAGSALGIAWSPCIGPTLGAAIALASTGESLGLALTIMLAYGFGIGTVFLALSYGGKELILSRKKKLQSHSEKALKAFGLVSILVGAMILTQSHKILEVWLLDILPTWVVDLSVKL